MNIPEAISNPWELSLPGSRVRPEVRCIRRPPDVEASEDFPATTHGGSATSPPCKRGFRPRSNESLDFAWREAIGASVMDVIEKKKLLRTELRRKRKEHAAALPP